MNTINLVEKDKVFLLFNYVGTPTTTRILPLLLKYSSKGIYLFCPFTGFSSLYRPPYNKFVYKLRVSYFDEVGTLVDNFVAQGFKKNGVFYQIDAYGRDGWQGIQKALHKYSLPIVAEATYRRGVRFTDSFTDQAHIFLKKGVDAIISIASYEAAAGFIRDARNQGLNVPIANISFVNPEAMGDLLFALEKKTGKDYTRNLINTQVVPFYIQKDLPTRKEYKMCMDKYQPVMPKKFDDGTYQYKKYGAVSFEGFLNAKLITMILRNLGSDLKCKDIPDVMHSLEEINLGIDARIFYSCYHKQGLDKVYFITFHDKEIKPIQSFQEFIQ